MKDLRGTNAIVTGASRGLGVLICDALAKEGVNIALAARSAELLEKVKGDVEATGVKTASIPTDVSDRSQLQTLVTRAEAELGPIDILVNNAGIESVHPYERYPTNDIVSMVDVNLTAPLVLTRLVLPGMLDRSRGHIVNIASLAGKGGFPCDAPYSATKAALIMFSQVLRSELHGTPVGCSVVCPGFVSAEGMYADIVEKTGVRVSRMLGESKPEAVADAVVKSIKRGSAELIVNPTPLRPVLALSQLFPDIGPRVHKLFGVTDLARRTVDALRS